MIINNMKRFLLSITTISFTMIISMFFPHEAYFRKPNTWILGIPIHSFDGYNPVGFMCLAVLGVGLYLLATSLKKYKPGLVFITVFLFIVLPPLIFHLMEQV